MDTAVRDKLLDMGLGQEAMPTEGLLRLKAHIEAGKPLLMSGLVLPDRDLTGYDYG